MSMMGPLKSVPLIILVLRKDRPFALEQAQFVTPWAHLHPVTPSCIVISIFFQGQSGSCLGPGKSTISFKRCQ